MQKKTAAYKSAADTKKPMDFAALSEAAEELLSRFRFIERIKIGESYFGSDIFVLKIGSGAKKVLYVGSHHGSEWITSLILARLAEDFCRAYVCGGRICGYDPEYILHSRTMLILPMLNPDGVGLAVNGLSESNPIGRRLLEINGGSLDFSRWQANARGVDLNHNYDAGWDLLRKIEADAGINGPAPTRYGGQYAESEPEVAALASFARGEGDIAALAALHTQGEEIYWRYGDNLPPKAEALAGMIARATGYSLGDPGESIASHGGCKDWFISAFNRPGFTIECGRGINPLPIGDFAGIYGGVAQALILLAAHC